MKRIFVAISVLIWCVTLNYAVVGDNVFSGVRELPLPSVPDTLTLPSHRAAFVMYHFWDAMDWTDSLAVADRMFMEQNFANFYSLFEHTDSLSVVRAVDRMVDAASVDANAIHTIFDCSAQYLDEIESPVFNLNCYDIVAHSLLRSPLLNHTDSLILAYKASQLERNRVGTRASDFNFRDNRTGKISTLYQTVSDTPHTLLVFYNPGCKDCLLFEKRLISDAYIMQLISDKKLKVLLINPYGESTIKGISVPDSWIEGFSPDGKIDEEEEYYIPMIPAIFLLDSRAHVCGRYLSPFAQFESWLK